MSDDHPTILALPQVGEEFRDIANFPGYQVSNLGRVRRCWRWNYSTRSRTTLSHWCLVAQAPSHRNRYLTVVMMRDSGKRVTRTAHSLVAEAFIGPRPPGMHVCHRDNDGRNNRDGNLRYDTPKGNAADKVAHGTHICGSRQWQAKVDEAQVREIKRRLAAGDKQQAIADDFGVTRPNISNIKTGRTWAHLE